MENNHNVILRFENVSKSFPSIKALSNICLDVFEGEVHAIVGENGAGKSTLMKILSGVIRNDTGKLYLYNKETKINSTQHAINLGISCIYQELTIFPLIDIAKNIFLGNLPLNKWNTIKTRSLYSDTQKVLDMLELKVSPKTLCKDLSIAQQQIVEIGRAVSRNIKIIIMDEPTSSLTNNEKEVLFKMIRMLKDKGVSVLYVSHKLEEIEEISDRVTILRDGCKVKTVETEKIAREEIIEYMIGRKIDNYFNKIVVQIGETVLKVENLSRKNQFNNISFEVKKGEVLGFFGLIGSGRTEIMETIFGTDKAGKGQIYIDGKRLKLNNNVQAIKDGICLVPEDRKTKGLVLKLSVKINSAMIKIRKISKLGYINNKKEKLIAEESVDTLNIKTPSIKQIVNNLSGGNQQKIVIAKWLSMNPKVLILDEPTRGIDVGAKSEIYSLINKLAKMGVAIILVSSELPEIMGMCDRVMTIFEGEITAMIERKNFDAQKIMDASLGGETFVAK